MKKNLFYYLFAVLCTVCLFTACSDDDDEDTTWQQIPEITDSNVTLKLNDKAPAGATAALDITNGESGKLTLKNLIYGYPTVDVNVTLQKKDDTSYNFAGTANLDAARVDNMANAPLVVKVSGTVDTAGKMTVDVVTGGWAAVSGVYANDSLAITFDGKTHNNGPQYAVTLTATGNESATLVFKKIINVALNVEANVSLIDGKISGTVEPLLGYTITISGSVSDGKLTLDMVSSGYGTIKGSYSAGSNEMTFNGEALASGSVMVDILAENKANISLSNMFSGSRTIAIEDVVITKEEGKEVYNLNGKVENDDYSVTFKGTVGEDRKLKADITYAVVGAIVGKWNTLKVGDMATPIFKFSTMKGSVTLPESLLALIPEGMKPMFPATMPDAQLTQVVQGLLGTYAVNLLSIEFTATGRVIATYMELPKDINGDGVIDAQDMVGMTPKTFDMLQYYMKDGQLYLTVSLEDLMGMMPTNRSARAWDPSGVLTEGIPVGYQINGNTLSVSLVTDVVVGLAGFANGMLPLIGMMLPEEMKAQFEVIQAIFSDIMEGVIPDVKELEVGLVFTK